MSIFQPPLSNVESAHSVRGIPLSEIIVPYPSTRSLLDSQVMRYGGEPFLIHYSNSEERTEWSFNEVFRLVSRTANLLVSLGAVFGDRIAIDTPNHAETVIQLLGVWMIGGTAVVVDSKMESEAIQLVLNHSESKLAFLGREHEMTVDEVADRIPHLDRMITAGKEFTTASLKDQNDEFKIGKKSKVSDDGLIIYTIASDGCLKGSVLSHYNILVDSMAIADRLKIVDTCPIACGVDLSNVQGIIGCVMTALYAGCSVIIHEQFDPEAFFERASREKAQLSIMDAARIDLLIDSDSPKLGSDHFRFIVSTQNLTAGMVRAIREKFGIRIIGGYGLPEATCFSSLLPLGLSRQDYRRWMLEPKLPSVGTPLHPNEMDIHDEQGGSLHEGEVGEMVIRGHNVMKRYLKDEEATQEAFKHGWLRTGDEGFYLRNEEGERYFFVVHPSMFDKAI